MPPRIRLRSLADLKQPFICIRCQYASTASEAVSNATSSATTIPVSPETQHPSSLPSTRYSAIQPPSHRDPAHRKSQLLRSYVSLLQTTPLIILFQHNNLKALEWASIRRELATALQKVDDTRSNPETTPAISDNIKLTVIRTNIFEPALRVTEYYKPSVAGNNIVPTDGHGIEDERLDPTLTHALSRNAYNLAKKHKNKHPLTPLLTGPLAALTFPTVSPQHVKAALSILSPKAPHFPAPTRRANKAYHEPAVQDGLKKLLLLGARIDGQVFDIEGTRWVGSIEGGMDGLRAQLVGMLQGFGAGVTTTLETASRNLWFTMEGRRRQMEDEAAPKTETETEQGEKKE
ncbi:hypothetical protein PMZ80_001091 [Knufia obscura]|uniref:Ribosomal protein YmL11, mitochondrial n=2 Tax=Knufia TaxID=430999 RepID=A0AAN8EU19_9EURO|nr:hypothetical protein PMZ80_001091 [Knufia obscura]KAK5958842.1 hypothetical protein OHC33_000686 [Knufia fluminis]